MRAEFPRWGKEKLHRLIRKYRGVTIPVSRIGRILKNLKDNGKLIEGFNPIKVRKARKKRPHARRKPREYIAVRPGDIVQVDTLDVRPVPGVYWYQFTARDVVSRWDVLHLAPSKSSLHARNALHALLERAPFEVKAIQVDGGSEYRALFEQAAQELGIKMFVLPPRSPNLNGHVERAQRTHTEEFYEVRLDSLDREEATEQLAEWEYIYNNIRPHQSIDYQTPAELIESLAEAS
jgi:transposase InsO family protein